jgi:hypothetical protein
MNWEQSPLAVRPTSSNLAAELQKSPHNARARTDLGLSFVNAVQRNPVNVHPIALK